MTKQDILNDMNEPFECITSFQNGTEVGERKELVRCKNCKKRNTMNCWLYFLGRLKVPDNWFCADGEREGEK